uniref:Uncharacterized protein n=1 Tax=Gopherus agassizii TaxID=38772 RepID=A0A452GGS3_9SAUR
MLLSSPAGGGGALCLLCEPREQQLDSSQTGSVDLLQSVWRLPGHPGEWLPCSAHPRQPDTPALCLTEADSGGCLAGSPKGSPEHREEGSSTYASLGSKRQLKQITSCRDSSAEACSSDLSLQEFGLARFKSNVTKSTKGFEYVLAKMQGEAPSKTLVETAKEATEKAKETALAATEKAKDLASKAATKKKQQYV